MNADVWRAQHQRLDQFTKEEVSQCKAELETAVRERVANATVSDVLRGHRVCPPVSDLCRLYVRAWRVGHNRAQRRPGPKPEDVFQEDRPGRAW